MGVGQCGRSDLDPLSRSVFKFCSSSVETGTAEKGNRFSDWGANANKINLQICGN